jgi:hypothetical protein
MAYQEVGTGASANDGTGDDLRTGAGKINANIVELYAKVNGVATSAISDGTTITADSVALLTATQTLTNKTLTAPVLGGETTTASGNLQVNPATQILEVRGDGSSVEGQIQLNCHTNAHGQILTSADHGVAATNTLTLPGGTTIGNGDATLLSDTGTQTVTNKTIDLTDNTLSGTLTEFNTALSGDDFVSLTGTETLTNKTLTSPTITGTGAIAGTFTGNVTGNVDGIVGGTTPAAGSFTTVSLSDALQLAVFADGTARDAAITAPAAGMLCFLTDNGSAVSKAQVYDGSAWVDLH